MQLCVYLLVIRATNRDWPVVNLLVGNSKACARDLCQVVRDISRVSSRHEERLEVVRMIFETFTV